MRMPFLRTGDNWRKQLLETYATQNHLLPDEINLLKKVCQLKICRIFPIMDGWDELPPGLVNENLYLCSGFWAEENWPYLKVLSTCRPEAFVHYDKQEGGYRSIFHPKETAGTYTILNLSPFELRHIEAYVKRYLTTLPPDYIPTPLPLMAPSEEQLPLDKAKQAWLADYENYTIHSATIRLLAGKEKKQDDAEEKTEQKKIPDTLLKLEPFLEEDHVNWYEGSVGYEKHTIDLSGAQPMVENEEKQIIEESVGSKEIPPTSSNSKSQVLQIGNVD